MNVRTLLVASFLLGTPWAYAATVTTHGRQIVVNGQAFTVKGVNYSPTPVGSSVAGPGSNCIGPYHWWTDATTYNADFPQIRTLGANTVRTFDLMNSGSTSAEVLQALDAARANGLYVIMGYFVSHSANLADPTFRNQTLTEFTAAVTAYKNHPAVLMWAFGNENNLDNGYTNTNWYTLVQAAASAAHAADPDHPTMTVEGECLAPDCAPTKTFLNNIGSVGLGANDASLPALDVWGINIYRGSTFEGILQALAVSTMTAKPLIVTEFGKDAWRDTALSEDQDTQSLYIGSQWTEINSNLSTVGAGAADVAGGAVFEWTDEWWKDSGNDCQTHGSQVLFHRTTSDPVDPNYQDEWFGITSVSPINPGSNPNGTLRTQRKSFATLQAFWNPGGTTAASPARNFFSDSVHNYPNPFMVGTAPTRFVALVNETGSIDIRIFDASGRFVTGLTPVTATGPGRYELSWDGRNHQGEYVSPGLYYARIEGKGASHSDHQFRRVVAVK